MDVSYNGQRAHGEHFSSREKLEATKFNGKYSNQNVDFERKWGEGVGIKDEGWTVTGPVRALWGWQCRRPRPTSTSTANPAVNSYSESDTLKTLKQLSNTVKLRVA